MASQPPRRIHSSVRLCGLDEWAIAAVVEALASVGYNVVEEIVADDRRTGDRPDRTLIVSRTTALRRSQNPESDANGVAPQGDGESEVHSEDSMKTTRRSHAIEDEALQQIASAWVESGLDPEALRGILEPTVPRDLRVKTEEDRVEKTSQEKGIPGGGRRG